MGAWMHGCMHACMDNQTHDRMDNWMDTQMDRQTDRHTDTRTDIETYRQMQSWQFGLVGMLCIFTDETAQGFSRSSQQMEVDLNKLPE